MSILEEFRAAMGAAPRGALRVWHIPQIPMKPFTVDVATLAEAKLLLDALAGYDLFQLEHHIKPDYCNASGLVVFDDQDTVDNIAGSWVDWHSVDGEDIDHYTLDQLRTNPPKWEGAEMAPTCPYCGRTL